MRKKRYLNVISALVLTVSLLTGLLPVGIEPFTVAAAYSGVKREYDFRYRTSEWKNPDSSAVTDIRDIDYANTDGKWAYYGCNFTPTSSTFYQSYNLQLRTGAAIGSWFAMKLLIPVSGTYRATFKYRKSNPYGANADVWLIPMTALANITGIIDSTPAMGEIKTFDSSLANGTYSDAEVSLGEITVEVAGPNTEYLLVVRTKSKDPGSGTGYLFITGLVLDGEDNSLDSVTITADSPVIHTGKTAQISIESALFGNGEEADLTDASISYSSDYPAVASVDPVSGIVTGVSPGEAIITASVTLDEKTVYATQRIRVFDGSSAVPPSERQLGIDFHVLRSWTPIYSSNTGDIRGIDYEYSDGNWAWHSCDPDFEDNEYSFVVSTTEAIGRLRVGLTAVGQWVALRINVPAAGRYRSELLFHKYNSGGEADVYLLPGNTSDVEAALNTDTYLGSFSNVDLSLEPNLPLPTLIEFKDVTIPEKGEYLLVFRQTSVANGKYLMLREFHLLGNPWMSEVTLSASDTRLGVGDTRALNVSATMQGGGEVNMADAEINYISSAQAVATVDEYGNVHGVASGIAQITAHVTYGGVTRSDSLFVVVSAAALAASEGKLTVRAENTLAANALTVDSEVYSGSDLGSEKTANPGSQVTLTAAPESNGRKFMYWKSEAARRIVSTDLSYSFRVGSDTQITAVYRDNVDGKVLVEYIDRNGRILYSEYIQEGSVIPGIDDPFSVGYVFSDWGPDYSEGMTAEQDRIFIARYTPDTADYTVTVIGGTGSGSYGYNVLATVTADVPENDFACWIMDGSIVSYKRSFSLYVWDDITVSAVSKSEIGSIEQAPVLYMAKPRIIDNRAIMLSGYSLLEGCEMIETGILFSSTNTVPTLLNCDAKAVSQSAAPSGQFTARRDNVPAGGKVYARAYMIYKAPDNSLNLIYSNTVTGTP